MSAQLEAFLADDYWLELARHANRLADRLAGRLSAAGVRPVWPVEANLLFCVLPRAADARMQAAGATYYVRQSGSLPRGVAVGPDQMLVRLVTSFATSESDVDRFAELVRAVSA